MIYTTNQQEALDYRDGTYSSLPVQEAEKPKFFRAELLCLFPKGYPKKALLHLLLLIWQPGN